MTTKSNTSARELLTRSDAGSPDASGRLLPQEMIASGGLTDQGGRPRNPSVTAAILSTIGEIVEREGFWCASEIAPAVGWAPDVLERLSKRHRKLKRLRARADASLLAKLGDALTRKALGGDRGAIVMCLKANFGWAGARDQGGSRVNGSKLGALFADLDEAASE